MVLAVTCAEAEICYWKIQLLVLPTNPNTPPPPPALKGIRSSKDETYVHPEIPTGILVLQPLW